MATFSAILPTASWDTAWGSYELLLPPSAVLSPLRSVIPPNRVSVQSALQQWQACPMSRYELLDLIAPYPLI